jgi:DNA sulfur modification protein DndE
MKPPIDAGGTLRARLRFSKAAKDQLIKLKRVTKIEQWNTLCRWAFCRSLAEPTPPSTLTIPSDSNLEIEWHTLAGELGDIFLLALRQRCQEEGLSLDDQTLAIQLRSHLHRGISYLAAEIKDLPDLMTQGLSKTSQLTMPPLSSERDTHLAM